MGNTSQTDETAITFYRHVSEPLRLHAIQFATWIQNNFSMTFDCKYCRDEYIGEVLVEKKYSPDELYELFISNVR